MQHSYSHSNPRRRDDSLPFSAPARLRKISGMTIRNFAALCGIKYDTFRGIEKRMNIPASEIGGRTPITRYNAELISLVAGADVEALMKNQLLFWKDQAHYTEKHWTEYQTALARVEQQVGVKMVEPFRSWIDDLFSAPGVPEAGQFLWRSALAVELDRLIAERSAYLISNPENRPPLIPKMLEITRAEMGKRTIKGIVSAKKLKRDKT